MKWLKNTVKVVVFILTLPFFLVVYLLCKKEVKQALRNEIIKNKEKILRVIDKYRLKVRNM